MVGERLGLRNSQGIVKWVLTPTFPAAAAANWEEQREDSASAPSTAAEHSMSLCVAPPSISAFPFVSVAHSDFCFVAEENTRESPARRDFRDSADPRRVGEQQKSELFL